MRMVVLTMWLMFCTLSVAQSKMQSKPTSNSDMSGMDMSTGGMGRSDSGTGSAMAMHSMDTRHMSMGPHMKMTQPRQIRPGDRQKADEVVEAARRVSEKYRDYKVALADGYKIFLPKFPQKQYHFTNYQNAWMAREHFDASKPTSLLYEKHGDDYQLIGIMYTAKKNATEDELNARIPLSIAQWHAHVNLCLPPRSQRDEVLSSDPKFGVRGSIATKEECDAAGGHFFPQVFGWMVHLYPFEHTSENIWSVERQMHDHQD
jgi:hypothetical protein